MRIRRTTITFLLVISMIFSMNGCREKEIDLVEELGLTAEVKEAEDATANINSAIYSQLDFADTQEAVFAACGLIDAPEVLELKDENGKVVWSQKAYAFLDDYEAAPDTVNPSL